MKVAKFKIVLIMLFITLGVSISFIKKYLSNQEISTSDYLIAGLSFLTAALVALIVIIVIEKKGNFMHYKKKSK